jgi:hypothetical protein
MTVFMAEMRSDMKDFMSSVVAELKAAREGPPSANQDPAPNTAEQQVSLPPAQINSENGYAVPNGATLPGYPAIGSGYQPAATPPQRINEPTQNGPNNLLSPQGPPILGGNQQSSIPMNLE